ncbi:MAG: hypothetical protein JEY96_11200 [Bacteroidales bacterium]|nr:hypothetical protein [Bacteroidales bacterium]
MKNLLIISLVLVTSTLFGQNFYDGIDPISITKPEMENEVIDPSVFANLEPFQNNNDAIVYVIRSKSMVGSAVKWAIEVDKALAANVKNKEYFVIHLDGTQKGHSFFFPHSKFNYTNIKPNKYYFIKTKGFALETGYFNEYALKELKKVKLSAALKK